MTTRDWRGMREWMAELLARSTGAGVEAQARKIYVSLVSPRRTFARVQPTTKRRVDLGLRLEGHQPGGRLQPSKIHETTPLQVSLTTPDEVDGTVVGWLKAAYQQSLLTSRQVADQATRQVDV